MAEEDQFLGEIRLFGGVNVPTGWAFCNGQLLDISENSALYSLIGTTYGGDGFRTFALPDLRGRVPLANIKPRLRMSTLYFFANTLNYLVAGTGNRSELSIGYFSKYGDGGCDLLPIGQLAKSEVRAMARELNIPPAIIERTPSAGLWLGQTDEEEMGFTYADLEQYLDDGAQAVSPALAMRIERLMRLSEHKRQLPPTPDID